MLTILMRTNKCVQEEDGRARACARLTEHRCQVLTRPKLYGYSARSGNCSPEVA